MSFELIYAASLVATFIAWRAATLIPNCLARGALRATVIALFFSAAAANLARCYWAARAKQAYPLLALVPFSVPVLLLSPPNVVLVWDGAGAVDGLIGSGRGRIVARMPLGVFTLLSLNSAFRTYLAATAAGRPVLPGLPAPARAASRATRP